MRHIKTFENKNLELYSYWDLISHYNLDTEAGIYL